MAIRHIEQLVCDFCERVVDENNENFFRSVQFAFNSEPREVDLCNICKIKIEDMLVPLFSISRLTTEEIAHRLTGKPNVNKGRTYPLVECPVCHGHFKGNQGVSAHIKQRHSEASNKQICDECGRECDGYTGLRSHMNHSGHKSHQANTPPLTVLPKTELETAQA